jgi:hypothetical protein
MSELAIALCIACYSIRYDRVYCRKCRDELADVTGIGSEDGSEDNPHAGMICKSRAKAFLPHDAHHTRDP